jgi:hypothetical protein
MFIAPLSTRSFYLSKIIESTLGKLGLKPLDQFGNYLVNDEDMSETIRRFIEGADLIIADISGRNPNVMYEIGLAQGLGKIVLPIVSRDETEIPGTLARNPYLVYDPKEPENLRRYLNNWVSRYLPVEVQN